MVTSGARTGVCPYCRERLSLTAFWLLARHDAPSGGRCPGSGRPPLPASTGRPRRWHLFGRRANYLVFTLLAGIFGILSFFGLDFGGGGAAPTGPAPTIAAPTIVAPDPYQYVTDGSTPQHPRKQPCEGLLGLCLGQDVGLALEAFGTQETTGWPVSDGGGNQCHRWEPPRIGGVVVCDEDMAIRSISIDSMSVAQETVAAPDGVELRFPDPLAYVADDVSDRLGHPFESLYLQAEGGGEYATSWFFPPITEGGPEFKMTLLGQEGGFPNEPTPCSEDPLRYRYADVLKLSTKAPLMKVTVDRVSDEDTREPLNC